VEIQTFVLLYRRGEGRTAQSAIIETIIVVIKRKAVDTPPLAGKSATRGRL